MDDNIPHVAAWALERGRDWANLIRSVPVQARDAAEFINRYCNSEGCLSATLELERHMARDEWYQLLGNQWTSSDRIGYHIEQLRLLLPRTGPIPAMMTIEEQEICGTLPPIVTIYRGCGEETMDGMSWSFQRDVAKKFPFMDRYRPKGVPMIITARVPRASVLAIKVDRKEEEVVVFKVEGNEVVHQDRLSRIDNPFNSIGS